eukprot:804487-Rhodomonas_salina.3
MLQKAIPCQAQQKTVSPLASKRRCAGAHTRPSAAVCFRAQGQLVLNPQKTTGALLFTNNTPLMHVSDFNTTL